MYSPDDAIEPSFYIFFNISNTSPYTFNEIFDQFYHKIITHSLFWFAPLAETGVTLRHEAVSRVGFSLVSTTPRCPQQKDKKPRISLSKIPYEW